MARLRLALATVASAKVAVLTFGVLGTLAQAPVADPVTRARQLYNDGRLDDAIDAALEARQTPSLSNAAHLVLARAYLERFRKARAIEDLAAARDALAKVDGTALPAREHVELTVGLGQAVYLDGCLEGCYSAAAELFERALGPADRARRGVTRSRLRVVGRRARSAGAVRTGVRAQGALSAHSAAQ